MATGYVGRLRRAIALPALVALAGGLPMDAASKAPTGKRPRGDWPVTRGGALRAGRAVASGGIRGTPSVAWSFPLGSAPGQVITADLDGDGKPETYAAENWRVVRRDAAGTAVWRSPRISRGLSLVAFEDLDGDGAREPLMLGTGLNSAAPLYFVFDPKTGAIRWRSELDPSNGGDTRIGRIDPGRKGVQLLRALFPNPGGGELHLFCWDKGIEDGYTAWSWTRHDDFIYFPQLAVGDANGDGHNEALMLSQMCVWMFDIQHGREIARVQWGPRTRSYGGHFGLWPMRPRGKPSILVVSAYHRVSVADCDGDRLTLRWDHAFEPNENDTTLRGQVQFLQDGACDLDGDGWAEVVCNEFAGHGDGKWRTVVLDAHDGHVACELVGQVMVGAADIDGDGKAEVFLQDRVQKHDATTGRVRVARWVAGRGLETVWTATVDGSLVREPNEPALRLSRHPTEGDRVKLAPANLPGARAFFVRAADGALHAFEASSSGIRPMSAQAPADMPLPLTGLAATQASPPEAPLVVDYDGDGVNEVVARAADGDWLVLKRPARRQSAPAVAARIKGAIDPPVFADLDGDGRVEALVTCMGEPLDGGPLQQCLEARRADGSVLWRRAWPADHAYRHTLGKGGFAIMFAAPGHFTSRDRMDIAVSYTGETAGGHTAVLDGRSGQTVWDITTLYAGMYGSCWDMDPPVVLDHDGDGLDDIVTQCQTVHFTVLRGRDGKQLLAQAKDASNQGFGGEKPLFPGAWAVGALLGAADADGDGKPEIAVLKSQAAVGVVRADGETLWFLDLPVVKQVPSPGCWADVNGDGKSEVAFGFKDGFVRVYDGRTGALRWEEDLGATGALAAADVDGDGKDELLFSSEKGVLTCLADRPTGATESHVRWAHLCEGVPGKAVFAYVTGNGRGAILVPMSDGRLVCLTGGAAGR